VSKHSIQRGIVREFLATMGIVLLLTASALLSTTFYQFQHQTEKNLIGLTRFIGGNIQTPLLVGDEGSALQSLGALEVQGEIEAAIVYGRDGQIFAKWVRSDVVDFQPPREIRFEPRWSREHIDFASKIMLGDEEIGAVFIRADTRRARSFLLMSVGVVSTVLLISFFLC